jgi:RNA polymerase sigma-70 factor (ECF subfamily)
MKGFMPYALCRMKYPPDRWPHSAAADPDEDLLQEARNAPEGDLRAFEQLVLRHQSRVIANCRYITRDQNNAEDLAQEVLVKVFFGLRRFDGRSSFGGWLTRIKINHCLDHLRRQGSRSFVGIEEQQVNEFDQLKDVATAEKLPETISDQQRIAEVLDSLSSSLRVPLILCDMDGLTYEEVAKALGISLSATKMRIKRARGIFRDQYRAGYAAIGSMDEK